MILIVATSSSMALCGYKRMRGSYYLCVVRLVAICPTSYLVLSFGNGNTMIFIFPAQFNLAKKL